MRLIDYIKRRIKKNSFLYNIYIKIISVKKTRCIKQNGREVLSILNTCLDDLGLDYFIDFGTLLGMIRDREFIRNDLDLDLGLINYDNNSKYEIFNELTKLGFKKVQEFTIDSEVKEESYIYKGVKIDFFYYESFENKRFCYLFYREPSNVYESLDEFSVYKFVYEKITSVEKMVIDDISLNIPKNTHEVLKEKYGADWRVKKEKWHFKDSPSIHDTNLIGKIKKYKV
jgi:hypothetical protein